MVDETNFVPRVTGNSVLLLGYLSAGLYRSTHSLDDHCPYKVAEVHPADGYLIVEHDNGNRYRISCEQISGTE
jgi:hypothetical protein